MTQPVDWTPEEIERLHFIAHDEPVRHIDWCDSVGPLYGPGCSCPGGPNEVDDPCLYCGTDESDVPYQDSEEHRGTSQHQWAVLQS